MANAIDAQVETQAREWLRLDRDQDTRSEIQKLLYSGHNEQLSKLLLQRLKFGTAGLRARMGVGKDLLMTTSSTSAGFSQINSLTIIQTTQGLAEYLLACEKDVKTKGVVVGFDARHNSKHFAELTAAVFVHKNIRVFLCEDIIPTPLVSFAVKHLKAAAGVMITASHNPAPDNGYKLYGSNSCQINAPADKEISEKILDNLEPMVWDTEIVQSPSALVRHVRNAMTNLYMGYLWDLMRPLTPVLKEAFQFVYTPMHGVGYHFMSQAVANLSQVSEDGETNAFRMSVVEKQAQPDGDFPTVKYPNPEESGALDLAKVTADELGIDFIIANDPDADRLAAAEKVDGQWIQFTGDQMGVLLAQYIWQNRKFVFKGSPSTTSDQQYLLTTAVSSQMLSHMAEGAGFLCEETLTGFKWLGNRARVLKDNGAHCLFAYEESIGYMIPDFVFEKDAILLSALLLCACAAWGSPWKELQRLYTKYGHFVTMNTYWRATEITNALETFKNIRTQADPHPSTVAGRRVLRWRDLGMGFDSQSEDHRPSLPWSSKDLMITCWLQGLGDDGVRFTIRASGTEPKIKLYLECRAKDDQTGRDSAASVLQYIGQNWMNAPGLTLEAKYQSLVTSSD